MSNYIIKSDIEIPIVADTSDLAKKVNLACLKSKVDRIDVDSVKTVSIDFFKLRDVVKNIIIEKSVFDGFVKKVNTIDTKGPNSGLFSKTQNSLDKKNLEKGSVIPKLQN